MSYVFGPVPSRRLGRSLGVDVVPFKACTYDCVYCQLGLTTEHTSECSEWARIDEALAELKPRLESKPDYITLSGSGEPTLFSRLGELITRIKAMTEIPVAVLTNGSLLWREEVREQLLAADLVVPFLDAGDEETWRKVNRPVENICFDAMLSGLIDFREAFAGELWLEVLLLGGISDSEEAVARIAACARRIGPDRIQLNTVSRPPAKEMAMPVPFPCLQELARLFDPPAEIVADFPDEDHSGRGRGEGADILDTIRRHPCTIGDLMRGLRIDQNEAKRGVEALLSEGRVIPSEVGGKVYYRAPDSSEAGGA